VQQELAETKNLLHAVFEQSPIPMAVANLDAVLTVVNPACKENLGIEDLDIVGESLVDIELPWDTYTPDGRLLQAKELPLARAVMGQTVIEELLRVERRDRSSRWVSVSASPVFNDQGKQIAAQIAFPDVTELQQAQQRIQESEERYRLLADNSADLIWTCGERKDGFPMTYMNPAVEEMLGYTVEEFLQLPVEQRMTVASLQIAEKATAEIVRTGKIGVFEIQHIHKNGKLVPCELLTKPLLGVDGQIFGFQGRTIDITKRKQTEKALKESEERFKALHHASFGGIAIHDKGIILECNKGMSEITGFDYNELIGMNGLSLISDDTRDHVITNINAGYEIPYEAIGVRKNGEEYPLRIEARNIPYKGENARVVEFRDITESKQAQKEKARFEAKYRQAQKMESLGLLAGGVAHDLNNVLSGIVSYPELLLMDLPDGSKLRKPLEKMHESGLRAAAIVQDLLTMDRGVATTKEPMNLNDVIIQYLSSPEYNELIRNYPAVEVKIDLDDTLLNINASHVHIQKVVMNLVVNAAEAIKGSGKVMISTVNRYLDKPIKGYDEISRGEYTVLSISDDGSGISSNDLERIFEPFYTKKKMGRSGTGLGLSVVWNVMQDHNGYIDVATDESGTTFALYFPITRDAMLKNDMLLSVQEYKGSGETILVVDDEEKQREISCNILDALGYKCESVSSGEAAVEYLEENSVNLLLLDMIMDPGISGYETFKRIIRIHPGQKAIILSGFSETEEVKKSQDLGAGRYLKKPVTIEKIGIAIKEELSK